MRQRIELLPKLWRAFGTPWLAYRLTYAVRLRSGLIQRQAPPFDWAERPLASWLRDGVPSDPAEYAAYRARSGARFLFERLPAVFPPAWHPEQVVAQAEQVLAGQWTFFSDRTYALGFPPPWNTHPVTGQTLPPDRHWSKISDFAAGDIKFYWELSRFAFVYTLARAYAIAHDERYAAAFWALVADWAASNPPHRGPNWKCSQEASLRLMAWCFGLYAFGASPHTTPERVAQLAVLIAAHAERIGRFLAYARSQGGNHIVAEGTALWTVGLLFPELAGADRWRATGRRILEQEAPLQIYDDGAYEMHSFNYHRSVLHTLFWAIRLGEVNHARLAQPVYDAVSRSVDFFLALRDDASGQWPMYGRNDGSLLLPLTTCDQRDLHPTLQLGHYLVTHTRLFPAGPWDESLAWFYGDAALDQAERQPPAPPASAALSTGGYYTLRGPQSWVMLRCATFRHRPYEADQLHLDVWWRGLNVVCEPGTYRYNAEGIWNHGLNRTLVHNTLSVDGQDQMRRVGRFLWVDWSRGRVTCRATAPGQQLDYWEGTHDGYRRLNPPATHRRGVLRLGDEHWLVVDHLISAQPHTGCVHWLLPDFPYVSDPHAVTLQTEKGDYQVRLGTGGAAPALQVIRAAEDQLYGWRSLYYDEKRPALSVLSCQTGADLLFWSLLGPPVTAIDAGADYLHIQAAGWDAALTLSTRPGDPLLRTAHYHGPTEDRLILDGHGEGEPGA